MNVLVVRFSALIIALFSLFGVMTLSASAHEGEEHGGLPEAVEHAAESANIQELESLVSMLKELVNLLAALKVQQAWDSTALVVPVSHHDEEMG